MADCEPAYSCAADWLAATGRYFASRIERIVEKRTASGEEIGLGFVPAKAAVSLAAELADQDVADLQFDRPDNDLLDPARIALLPVGRMIAACGLPSRFASWAAAMLLAEQDFRWGTLFAWLNDNAAMRVPTAGLLEELVGDGGDDVASLLAAGSPLNAFALLASHGDGSPLPDRPMRFAPHVARWLLGDDLRPPVDAALAGYRTRLPCIPREVIDPDDCSAVFGSSGHTPSRLQLTGEAGTGRALLAQDLLGKALVIDGERLSRAAVPLSLLKIALRDATLRQDALIVTDANYLEEAVLLAVLGGEEGRVALTTDCRMRLEWPTLDVPKLGHARSLSLWRFALEGSGEGVAERMAQQFRLGANDILRVCAEAEGQGEKALVQACLARSSNQLARYATAVTCRHEWDDLVLPPRQMRLLKSIAQRMLHAHTVYDTWNFAAKLAPDRGLTALFSGPSGSGKTLSASVVARALGLPLYRVDLSATISKFIGETEKQLEQIFCAAEAGNACLFFDECDALFGKRSEVSDAHDRYANIETSYLLQRLENHRGTVFLASNYPQNIDEAFTRRIDLTVEFPMPDGGLREQLWRCLMPDAAEANIDTVMLGRQFELSGGSIRNCLLTAAFLAAQDNSRIETQHCLQAVAQEYEKTGRPLTRLDFGDTFAKLRPARTGE